MAAVLSASGDGFTPPGPQSFELPPIVHGAFVTKPMVLLVLAAVVVFVFFYLASRKAAIVPGRLQFVGEYIYSFTRDSIARDSIGSEHYMKFVPYIFTLFSFLLVNNYFGILPIIQFPVMGRIGFVVPLAILTWIIFNAAGIYKHGFFGYLKHVCVPGGVRGIILGLIVPLEFLSTIIVRPFTLALRLFANMFAGHMLLILFSTGGFYLMFETGKPLLAVAGATSFLLGVAVSFLELLVMFLQAYVFTLLTAQYIGGALAEEH
jgi:F-type H+-transporting ATPase subunit a